MTPVVHHHPIWCFAFSSKPNLTNGLKKTGEVDPKQTTYQTIKACVGQRSHP